MLDEKKFAEVEERARLHAMPPSTPLSTEFAAAFLGCSVATMEAMRQGKNGPVYNQPTGTGPNMRVMYQISELLSWLDRTKVASITDAMIRAGKAFTTIADLQRDEAFWIDARGLLCGLVGESTIATVRARLESHDVAWLPVIDAAVRQWSDVEAHRGVAETVKAIFKHTMQAVDANLEGTELRAALAEG